MKKYTYTDEEMKQRLQLMGYEVDGDFSELAMNEGHIWNDDEEVWEIEKSY